MTTSFATLLQMDARLAAAGHHALTPFWRETLRRFYESPTAKRLVARVGRGGAKSFTSAKVGLHETLFGDWKIPPGERHFWGYISISKDEAAQRLTLLQSFLNALKVPHDVSGDTITLREMNRGFRVFACSVGGTSGFRCYGYSADEIAKWQGTDYSNPAEEVCASLGAQTITHPDARNLLISSPFGIDGYHAEAFDQGNNEHQVVAHAASWVANPDGISEASARAKQQDPAIFAREYEAIPSATVSNAFDPLLVIETFKPRLPTGNATGSGWVALDPSSLRGDGFGCVAGLTTDADELVITAGGEFETSIGLREIVRRVSELARRLNTRVVFSDQREEAALRVLFEEYGIDLKSYAWSEPKKVEAVAILNRWMVEKRILVVPSSDHDATQASGEGGIARLRREMLAVRARITLAGKVYYNTSGLDCVSCLLTLATASAAGDFSPGEPINAVFSALKKAADERAREQTVDLGIMSAHDQIEESLMAKRMAGSGIWGW